MSYHIAKIKKGILGEVSKLEEEIEEYKDAIQQNSIIMANLELSDIYGALEELALTHNLSMNDLSIMSNITKRTFKEGGRT